jgi:6-phosphogluconolactonase
MSQLELNIYPDPQALARAAVEFIAGSLRSCSGNPKLTFVLTGGSTPRKMYELLGTCCKFQDWSHIEFFWGDERCVPPDHQDSNFRLAQNSLLFRLPVPQANIHRIRGELKDVEKAALLYEEEIRGSFPGAGLPKFDLVLLGMGEDGHTASLFPGTKWDESRLVIVNHAPNPPFWRISMTPRLLNAARRVVFVVSGQAKAPALKRVLQDPSCDYPAKGIRPVDGDLTWLVDSAAASQLQQ